MLGLVAQDVLAGHLGEDKPKDRRSVDINIRTVRMAILISLLADVPPKIHVSHFRCRSYKELARKLAMRAASAWVQKGLMWSEIVRSIELCRTDEHIMFLARQCNLISSNSIIPLMSHWFRTTHAARLYQGHVRCGQIRACLWL